LYASNLGGTGQIKKRISVVPRKTRAGTIEDQKKREVRKLAFSIDTRKAGEEPISKPGKHSWRIGNADRKSGEMRAEQQGRQFSKSNGNLCREI